MYKLITIDDLKIYIGERELLQIAGSGPHNIPNGRVLDKDRLAFEIGYASEFIISYLAKRYPIIGSLKSESVPDLIKGYASDIIRYRLRLRSNSQNTVTEEVRKRYEDARNWLKDISVGRCNLEIGDGQSGNEVTPTGRVSASIPPARSARILAGYHDG